MITVVPSPCFAGCRRAAAAAGGAVYRVLPRECKRRARTFGKKRSGVAAMERAVAAGAFPGRTYPGLSGTVEGPLLQLTGLIENKRLKGDIKVPVTLNQAVWVEYKGWWFWKRVKAIHQSISSDNPYVEIRYSEYIKIDKK